jgi:hypothetical protein
MSDTQLNKDKAIFKDAAILAGWIAGLVIIAGLLWFFTQPVRNRILLNAVNQVLEQSGDTRRLEAPLPPAALRAGVSRIGFWYSITESPGENAAGSKIIVFAFIGEGSFFPCAAIVTPEGSVEEFIALTNHGERMLRRISPEKLKLYTRRFEGVRL